MSSISGISSYSLGSSYYSTASQRPQRPSADEMAADLFSKLDTSGKGYIEESDLASALSSLSSTASTSSDLSASEIFSQLDGDGDGKVTQDEMTSTFSTLAEALDSQFDQSRVQNGMPPPPPPAESDTGFTEEELTSQLSEIGDTDSARSSLISSVLENFSAADTNSDGKVSFQEAMAYQESTSSSTSSTSDASATSSTSASSETSQAQMFRQLMELLRTYGDTSYASTASSAISTTA